VGHVSKVLGTVELELATEHSPRPSADLVHEPVLCFLELGAFCTPEGVHHRFDGGTRFTFCGVSVAGVYESFRSRDVPVPV
jgi:hypothetical protein